MVNYSAVHDDDVSSIVVAFDVDVVDLDVDVVDNASVSAADFAGVADVADAVVNAAAVVDVVVDAVACFFFLPLMLLMLCCC